MGEKMSLLENMPDLFDDKLHVIWALTLIAMVAMWRLPQSSQVVSNVVSGLLGVAVGKVAK